MSDVRIRLDAASRRQRILQEALRIIGERGYYGFGIQELADRCGLTKAGLLHHVGSKDQLLIALLNDVDTKEQAELGAAFAQTFDQASPAEQVETFRKTLQAIVMRNCAAPEVLRLRVVLRVESINPDHPAHDHFAAREAAVLQRMERGAACVSRAPRSLSRHLLAMLNGLEEQWLRSDCGFNLLAEWTAATDRLLSTAAPAAAAHHEASAT